MDRTRTWPQELGQPVQCMRTFLGRSSCCSSFSTIAMARFLVSIIATPQNWAPVQLTSPRVRLPASMRYFWKIGSCEV